MGKNASSPWQALKRGVGRLFIGVVMVMLTVLVLCVAKWVAARLVNLITIQPVQLRDGVTTAIWACRGAICALAFGVGLGIPD